MDATDDILEELAMYLPNSTVEYDMAVDAAVVDGLVLQSGLRQAIRERPSEVLDDLLLEFKQRS